MRVDQGLRGRGACRAPSCARRPTTSSASRSRRRGSAAKYLPAIDLLPQLGLIAVLGIGGLQVINGDLTLGQLVAVQLLRRAARRAAAHARHDRRLGPARGGGAAAGQRGASRSIPRSPTRRTRSTCPRSASGTASARSASTTSTSATTPSCPVLDGFDLALAAGESVALVGATGSGKSTVARLLVRFYDVERGSVSIDGVDVRDLTAARPAPRGRHRVRGHVAVPRHGRRQHRLRRTRGRRRSRSSGPPGWPGAHDFIMGLPDALRHGARRARASRCRAASASASPSPGRSSPTRASSCSTTPRRPSTRRRSTRSARRWPR